MIPRRSERKWGRKIFGKIYFHERGNNDERRANANFIQRSVWPASPSRVVSNESRHPCKNFSIGRNGGMSGTGALPVPIVIENGAVDRPALPLCLRFTFAERRNFHPLSSDKSWGERYGKSMPRTWRRIRGWGDSTTRSRFTCPRSDAVFNRFSEIITSRLSTFFRELHRLLLQGMNETKWLSIFFDSVANILEKRFKFRLGNRSN